MQADNKTDKKSQTEPKSKLGDVFKRILEQLSRSGLSAADNSTAMIKKMVDDAIELEQAAEQMSSDGVHLLSEYVARDLSSLAHYLHMTGEGVAAWLKFDLDYLEQSSKEQFLRLADKSVLDNLLLNEKLACDAQQYLTGEVCLYGTLRCLNCGSEHRVIQIEVIEPCKDCQSDCFERISQ